MFSLFAENGYEVFGLFVANIDEVFGFFSANGDEVFGILLEKSKMSGLVPLRVLSTIVEFGICSYLSIGLSSKK